jgi:tRNA(fMet)-specific endonuclease VapC
VTRRVDAIDRALVRVSAIVAAELRYGAERSGSGRLRALVDDWLALFTVEPWDDDAARDYGRLRAALEARGRPIGNQDLLIAAHAVSRKATLVTNNTRHFSQVAGLKLENWMGRKA